MSKYAASALQYAQAVVSGEILTCEWVRKACQRQLDDLIRFKRKSSPYQFNPELVDRFGRPYRPADNLCAFIERLPHVKDPLASQLIRWSLGRCSSCPRYSNGSNRTVSDRTDPGIQGAISEHPFDLSTASI